MPEHHTYAKGRQRPVRESDGLCHEHGSVNLNLMTAGTQGVSSQDNGTNRFIVVLDWIDTGDFSLFKVIKYSRFGHTSSQQRIQANRGLLYDVRQR
jgi:hypothetical protein